MSSFLFHRLFSWRASTLAVALTSLLVSGSPTQASLVVSDSFNHPVTDPAPVLGGTGALGGGKGWLVSGTGTNDANSTWRDCSFSPNAACLSPSLSYTDSGAPTATLVTSGNRLQLRGATNNAAGAVLGRRLKYRITNGVHFVSFLTQAPTNKTAWIRFSDTLNNQYSRLWILQNPEPTQNNVGWQVQSYGTNSEFARTFFTQPTLQVSQVALWVIKFDMSVVPNTVTVWINPTSLSGAAEANLGTPLVSSRPSDEVDTLFWFDRIDLLSESGVYQQPVLDFDEVRIGTSLADVIPYTGGTALVNAQVQIATTDAFAQQSPVDTATYTVTRTGSTAASLDVDYAVDASSTATGGTYSLSPAGGIVTIPAGSATANITLTATANPASAKTVVLKLLSSIGVTATGSVASATILPNGIAIPNPPIPGDLTGDGLGDVILAKKKLAYTILSFTNSTGTLVGDVASFVLPDKAKFLAANRVPGTTNIGVAYLAKGTKTPSVQVFKAGTGSLATIGTAVLSTADKKLAGKVKAALDVDQDGDLDLLTVYKKELRVLRGPLYDTPETIAGVLPGGSIGAPVGAYNFGTANVVVFQKGKKPATTYTLTGGAGSLTATPGAPLAATAKILGLSCVYTNSAGLTGVSQKSHTVSVGATSVDLKAVLSGLYKSHKVVGPR